MDGRVTPPKRVTSPTWGPPPPCKQALTQCSFISPGVKILCVLYLHYNVVFTFK